MAERHKYGSPEDVAQRILEWLGQNARQDATSLLLYEAMQALKKCAASPADQGEDARDALMLELLESYEAIFRSAYCQLDADDDLIRRVRAAMSASKEHADRFHSGNTSNPTEGDQP